MVWWFPYSYSSNNHCGLWAIRGFLPLLVPSRFSGGISVCGVVGSFMLVVQSINNWSCVGLQQLSQYTNIIILKGIDHLFMYVKCPIVSKPNFNSIFKIHQHQLLMYKERLYLLFVRQALWDVCPWRMNVLQFTTFLLGKSQPTVHRYSILEYNKQILKIKLQYISY